MRRIAWRGLFGVGVVVLIAALAYSPWKRESSAGALSRASSAYGRGEWGRAEQMARAMLKSDRNHRGALRLLARSSARLGRDASAEAIYRRLGGDGLEAEDYYLLGRGLIAGGREQPGVASLKSALELEPNHALALEALAAHDYRAGVLIDARELADRLIERPGFETAGRVWLGRIDHALLDPRSAADALARAIHDAPLLEGASLSPDQARLLLARVHLESGAPELTLLDLDRINGHAEDAAWLASRALLQQGKPAEAQAALDRAGVHEDDPMRPEPAPYVGARRCRACHRAKYDAQQSSRHAQTFARGPALDDIPWPNGPLTDRDPTVSHRFVRSRGRVDLETTIRGRVATAIIDYALGSNHQGQTYLARDATGQIRETRVSHFPSTPEWDRTIDHPDEPPDEAGFQVRPISRESLRKCLHCHATDFQAAWSLEPRPESADRGIGCERCHGPGGNHLAAVKAHFPSLAIMRPRLAAAARIQALCGECHQPPSAGMASLSDIRFQAPRLARSRCYQESNGRLSCVTCHDPHANAQTSAGHYIERCLECHASSATKAGASEKPTWPPCPVSPLKGCLECHMPAVADAVPRSVFTDHWIRVRGREETKPATGR